MQKIQTISERVLKKITPKKSERARVEALSQNIEQKISLVCQNEGLNAIVRVEGSVAKDTWLSENPDIDVFIRFPTSVPRKSLGEVGLRIARKAAENALQVERFAEHPYLEVFMDGYRVDIVPCYDATPGEWKSATDRTPYHTDYIKQHLSIQLRREVRLLKKFMQGIDVYGAELKIGGFSGYLCELLVMYFGSFFKVNKAFAAYTQRIIIDLEGFYLNREKELGLLFPEPLIIIDPVDKGRNVASAVLPQKLYTYIAAAREFLKKPAIKFFYPPKPKVYSTRALKNHLLKRGSTVIFLKVKQIEAVPDVLWGQLYRSKRSLSRLLELNDYNVLRDNVWSNEKNLSVFFFELESQKLANIKKHLGPPIEREVECNKFLAKYAINQGVVSGPYIENGRWIVELPRKNTDAATLLKEKVTNGGKNSGVADLIAMSIKEEFKVLVNSEVVEFYNENREFSIFLTGFLAGKPFWLKAQ
jgi:tRNA nucleotidyltransferase (CCA-adding enzyme)